mmetsp:Transcript_6109/g.9810  ORF Transcript_6109/g.9810 Transcript_6109/m.9810 type:complete len:116 (+) Transcript_6109:258-605(+)
MGRMNEGFQSDDLKNTIKDYKKRKASGMVETYEDATGDSVTSKRRGLSAYVQSQMKDGKQIDEDFSDIKAAANKRMEDRIAATSTPTGWQIVPEERNALGLVRSKNRQMVPTRNS